MQYASKYYDPVKRHQYYMEHRQLKSKQSRTSTAGLNEDGKIAAKKVKEGIKEEQKAFNETVKSVMNARIQELRDQLKALPKEERAAQKEEFKEKIAQWRDVAKKCKEKAKEVFNQRYIDELDKIKQDPSFQKSKEKK